MDALKIQLSDEQLDFLASRIVAQMPNSRPKLFYKEREVAELLGVTQATLRAWRAAGVISASGRGRPVLYSAADLQAAAEYIATRADNPRG